jgi:hypothetical protein
MAGEWSLSTTYHKRDRGKGGDTVLEIEIRLELLWYIEGQ